MKESLSDYAGVMRARYARRPGKLARSALLDEYCLTTHVDRKYAIKVLRGQRRKASGGARRRAPATYMPQDIAVLKEYGWRPRNLAASVCPERCSL